MASIATHAFKIRRGDTFRRTLTIWSDDGQTIPSDLTNKTITGHARKAPDDTLWFDLNLTIKDHLNGVLEIHHTAAETDALSASELTGNYDIQIVDQISGDVTTFLSGIITVTKDYTHN